MTRCWLALILFLAGQSFGWIGMASADYVVIIANLGEEAQPATSPEGGSPPPGTPTLPTPGGTGYPGEGGATGYGGSGGVPGYGPGGGVPGTGEDYDMYGGEGGLVDVSIDPYTVVTVVEVHPLKRNAHKLINEPEIVVGGQRIPRIVPVPVKHRWGTSSLIPITRFGGKAKFLMRRDGTPLPTVGSRFLDKRKKTLGGEPSSAEIVELARWTLGHGLVTQCAKILDELVNKDKDHPIAVAYAKVKKDLERPLGREEKVDLALMNLMRGYRLTQTDEHHYAILHRSPTGDVSEVEKELDHLELSMRGFYYWWALREIALPIPRDRQLVAISHKPDDFKRYRKILTAGTVVSHGFFARREGVSVLSPVRRDTAYNVLSKASNRIWNKIRLEPEQILAGRRVRYPRTILPIEKYEAQMRALMLKSMELDARRTRITYQVNRQQLFASGLLPNKVNVPEWVLFGTGSFFGTSPQAPWPSVGAPSAYYLPRFRKMKAELGQPSKVLTEVVTDTYFRNTLLKENETALFERVQKITSGKLREQARMRAETTAWALMYYLAHKRTSNLLRYFKELSKMPRDLHLSEHALMLAFARAFDAVDAEGKVDKGKMTEIARNWNDYISYLQLEEEDLVRQIAEYYEQMKTKKKKPTRRPRRQPGRPPTRPGDLGGCGT